QSGAAITDPGVTDRTGHVGLSGSMQASVNALGAKYQARLWDAGSGKELVRFSKAPPGLLKFGRVWHPTTATFSPDGKQVAIAFAENDAAVWDTAGGESERSVLRGH